MTHSTTWLPSMIRSSISMPTVLAEKPLVSLHTLGCKLNQSETDSMAATLSAKGFVVSDIIEPHAKYIVINTCTVTAKADRKSRNIIYRALRQAGVVEEHAPYKAVVIVTGCFVGSARDQLATMGIDYLIDNSKKKYIPDIIEAHEEGQILDFDALPEDYFGYTPTTNTFHVRNTLKIQDGCDNFCTFCIIPMVRGKAQSRPIEDIVQDARQMIEQGTKEIVLTGVNMSRYSYEHYGFSDVLEGLLKLSKDFRIRISSLEPDNLDEKFYSLLAHPQICPHLHLCLQSGSERILLKMRRMYSTKEFLRAIKTIQAINPQLNMTTDAIVGFPGETEEDFLETVRIIKDCGFSHTHIFPYSDRSGTRASRMTDGVSIETIRARIKILEQINLSQKNQYRLAAEGKTQTILVEKTMSEQNLGFTNLQGLSEYYIPIEVEVSASHEVQEKSMINTLLSVQLRGHRIQDREVIMRGHLIP